MTSAAIHSVRHRVRLLLAAVLLALVTVVVQLPAAPADAHQGGHPRMERKFFNKINASRQRQGLPLLKLHGLPNPVRKMAQEHAWDMAGPADCSLDSDQAPPFSGLAHDLTFGAQLFALGYNGYGDNVGCGYGVGQIHSALLASDCHNANILSKEMLCPLYINGKVLNRDWTAVAIGVEVHQDKIWVSQIFTR